MKVVDSSSHIANIGSMIEEMENSLRSKLDALYISKTRDILANIRTLTAGPTQGAEFVADLSGAILRHGAKKADTSA